MEIEDLNKYLSKNTKVSLRGLILPYDKFKKNFKIDLNNIFGPLALGINKTLYKNLQFDYK